MNPGLWRQRTTKAKLRVQQFYFGCVFDICLPKSNWCWELTTLNGCHPLYIAEVVR